MQKNQSEKAVNNNVGSIFYREKLGCKIFTFLSTRVDASLSKHRFQHCLAILLRCNGEEEDGQMHEGESDEQRV